MSSRFITEVLSSDPALFLYGNSNYGGNAPRDIAVNAHTVTTENTAPSLGVETGIAPHPLTYWTFNGSTQEWRVADAASLEIGNDAWSVMAVFRASSAGSGTQQIFSKRKGTTPHNFHMAFLHGSNKVQFRGSAGGNTQATNALNEDQWYIVHAAITGTTTCTTYVDGDLDTSGTIDSADIANATDVHIGAREDDSNSCTQFFQGDIGPVAVWNSTLSSSQVMSQAKAFYGFDRMRPSIRHRRYGRRLATGGLV